MFPSYWFSCCTWPSVDARVRSSSLSGLPNEDRVPRIHMMAERRMAKLSRHLSHPMTMEKKDGFKASLMTCTSDTVRTHLQSCRTLSEGLLKLCAHQSPYTGRAHRFPPSPQAASVRPRFEPTATPPSRVTSRGCYRYANPIRIVYILYVV